MKKKTIYTIFISLGILVLLLVGIYAFSGNGLLSTYDTCSGGTVASIDNVEIKTSSNLGGKKVVRVTYESINTGECLDIEAREGDLSEFLGDGFDVTDPILGDIELTKTQQVFNLQKNTDKFYRLVEVNVGKEFSCSKSADCPSKSGATLLGIYVTERTWTWGDCICVYASEEGIGGRILSSSDLLWETKISIGSSSTTLSNSKLSGKIGNFAFAKWAGNTMGNKVLDNPDFDLFFDYTKNDFSLIYEGTHGELEDDYNSFKRSLVTQAYGSAGNDQVGRDLSSYNSLFDTSTDNLLSDYISDESLVGDAEFDDNKLVVSVSSPIAYPKFILDIEAERVGIFQTIGKPEVNCPSKISIDSGDLKNVYATIKNVGTSSGSFGYSIDCNDGSQTGTPDSPISISKGSSKRIKIQIGNTVPSGTENTRCKFTAYEINSGEEDSCNFNYDSTYVSQCTVGEKSCESGNAELWTCLSGGGYDIQDCEYGCEAFENTFRCKKQTEICDDGIDNDGNGLIDEEDPVCQGKGFWDSIKGFFSDLFGGYFDFFTYLKLAIVAVFSLVSIFVSSDLLKQIESLKEIEVARWGISVVVGVGMAFLLYTFIYSFWFWILLIAGMVYLLWGKPIVNALKIIGR